MSGDDRPVGSIDATADHRLRGEGVARWIPALLALVGLAGAMTAALLAVDGDDDAAADLSSAAPTDEEATADRDAGAPSTGDADSVDGTTTSQAPATTVGPSTTEPGPTSESATTTAVDCPPVFVVRFALGGTEPIDDHEADARALAAWLTDDPDARLLIDGHADAGGSEQTNLRLSFRRAETVAALLIGAGVEPGQIQARGFGEYQPIVGVPLDSEANRRVTMQVDGLDACPIDDEDSDP